MKVLLIQENLNRSIYLLSLTTMCLCLIKQTEELSTSWPIVFIPLQVSIILVIPSLQIYASYSFSKLQSGSVYLFVFSSYTFALSIFAFILLLPHKLEDSISSSWYVIFIPLWWSIFAFTAFAIFMFPGMMDPTVNMKRQAWTMIGYVISLITASIIIVLWLEDVLDHLWPGMVPLMLVSLLAVIACFRAKSEYWLVLPFFDFEGNFYCTMLPLAVLCSIKVEEKDYAPTLAIFLIIIKFLVCMWGLQEQNNYQNRKEEAKENFEESMPLNISG